MVHHQSLSAESRMTSSHEIRVEGHTKGARVFSYLGGYNVFHDLAKDDYKGICFSIPLLSFW